MNTESVKEFVYAHFADLIEQGTNLPVHWFKDRSTVDYYDDNTTKGL